MAGNVSGGPRPGTHPLLLEKGVGDRAEDRVVGPAGIAAPFEMVEAELVLEVLVLLLDRPPLMRQADQARQAGRGGQVDEVLFAPPGWAQSPLAQEPHLGREPPLPPVVRGGHPQGGEVGRPGGVGPIAPRHAPPRGGGQLRGQGAGRQRDLVGPPAAPIPWGAGVRLRPYGGRAPKQGQLARDPHGIGQAPARQGLPQRAVVAIFGVADHRRDVDPPPRGRAAATSRRGATSPGRRRGRETAPCARRAGSCAQATGRYSVAPSSQARTPVQSATVTATWQLATLPSAPQYCRATPTECVPCLGKLVSSRISTPRRSGTTARRRRHTGSASQGAWVMKCWKV